MSRMLPLLQHPPSLPFSQLGEKGPNELPSPSTGESARGGEGGGGRREKRWPCAWLLIGGLALGGFGGPPTVAGQGASPGSPRVYLEVKDPSTQLISFAIPPLAQHETPALRSLRERVISDLEFSGVLSVLSNVPSVPPSQLTGSFPYAWWKDFGADLVIAVDEEESPSGGRLHFYVFDTALASPILETKMSNDPEAAAPVFMDELIKRLTGRAGLYQTRIAFVGYSKGAKEIYVADWDGRHVRPITRNGSINLAPAWDVGGKRLLYTSYVRRNPDLYVYEMNPGVTDLVSNYPGLNYGAEISPDGKQIVATITKARNSDLYVMDIGKGGVTRLTDHPAIDSSPTWSPDGRRVAFVSDRSGTPQVYVMDAQPGAEVQRLTFETTQNDSPTWSPRGDFIAYTGLSPEGKFHIYLVSTQGWGHRKVTSGMFNHEFPTWAPDGRHLAYTTDRRGRDQLTVVVADVFLGRERELDLPMRIAGWLAWSPPLAAAR
ncbi:MAG: PD40 domain-containing protein [Nitrospirae bacterium]|nr:PD40 domain-containing protein [Nitrospirota bacterium]